MMKRMMLVWANKHSPAVGKLMKLTRPDGTADLAVDNNGTLHRLHAKPKGKAARKEWKRQRRANRQALA